MKTLLNPIRRAGLWLAIFALDIHIYGQSSWISYMTEINGCPLTLGGMEIARSNARAELARLRSEYNATFPPGKRVIWNMA